MPRPIGHRSHFRTECTRVRRPQRFCRTLLLVISLYPSTGFSQSLNELRDTETLPGFNAACGTSIVDQNGTLIGLTGDALAGGGLGEMFSAKARGKEHPMLWSFNVNGSPLNIVGIDFADIRTWKGAYESADGKLAGFIVHIKRTSPWRATEPRNKPRNRIQGDRVANGEALIFSREGGYENRSAITIHTFGCDF